MALQSDEQVSPTRASHEALRQNHGSGTLRRGPEYGSSCRAFLAQFSQAGPPKLAYQAAVG